MDKAIGLLEVQAMVAAVAGLDAMLKAADVSLVAQYKDVGSAYVSATVSGDVASVKSAVEAGANAAAEVGTVYSVHVIARPHEGLTDVLAAKAPAKK